MSIVKMSKLSLAGHAADRERVIAKLMKLGLVEIVEHDSRNTEDEVYASYVAADEAEEAAASYEREFTRVGAAIDALDRFTPFKKPMFYSGRQMRVDEYKAVTHEFDKVWSTVERIEDAETKLGALRNEENRLNSQVASLAPWRAMPLPLEEAETRAALIMFGVVPATVTLDELTAALAASAPESYVDAVSQDAEFLYVVAVSHRDCGDEAAQVLKQFGFTRVQFKELTGTPERNITAAAARLDEIARARTDLERQLKQLAPQRVSLEVLYDYLEIRCERGHIISKLGHSDSVFYLEGWIPTRAIPELKSKLAAVADCYMEFSEPAKGEDHPILLDNPGIIKPFEAITSMYSLPSTRDVDPNILMTPFYFIFFGMMIGDFAYGLILSLIVGLMILKFKPPAASTSGRILRMLFLGGFSTAFWGMMFGSYFGNLPQALATWITGVDNSGKFYGLWFDPLADPMMLLIFSMILGVIHLFVGMGIKMYMLIKDGQVFAAIFDVGSWYILIVGLPLMALPGLFNAGMVMSIAGAAMLVLTQGRHNKNPIKWLIDGIMSLYGITGYLSDVLSYSRLLALGLATGVIAQVINTLAMLQMPGPVAFIVCLAIVIFGTVFNIAINALGAFVHSSRLQYVEFFSKFYEGGGSEYKPFRIKTKHVKVV